MLIVINMNLKYDKNKEDKEEDKFLAINESTSKNSYDKLEQN